MATLTKAVINTFKAIVGKLIKFVAVHFIKRQE